MNKDCISFPNDTKTNNHNFLAQAVCSGVKKDVIVIVESKIWSNENQCSMAVVGVGMVCAIMRGVPQVKIARVLPYGVVAAP